MTGCAGFGRQGLDRKELAVFDENRKNDSVADLLLQPLMARRIER